MNGYKIVLLKAILCFIGCRKVNGYAPEYVSKGRTITEVVEKELKNLLGTEVKSKPVSSKLRGIVNLPEDFDYKKELENRSLKK